MAQIELVAHAPQSWFTIDSQTNAVATATKAAIAQRRHFITGLSLSMSASPAAAAVVTVKSGTTIIDQWQIPIGVQAPLVVNFPKAWRALAVNELVSISVTALGAAVIGTVSIRGFTTQD